MAPVAVPETDEVSRVDAVESHFGVDVEDAVVAVVSLAERDGDDARRNSELKTSQAQVLGSERSGPQTPGTKCESAKVMEK